MRVIRGGGGKEKKDIDFKQYYSSNPGQNFFFTKMLGNHALDFERGGKALQTKKSLNELKIEKYQQELKYLDNDELNNSKESDLYSIDQSLDTKNMKGKKDIEYGKMKSISGNNEYFSKGMK
jgi:hypothetical protein